MTLSIIIVNYNVRYFLEQCLYSVQLSSKKIKTEVFIVDNNSVDGSIEMIESKFPKYKLIKNKKNVGFSRANNQAIKKAKGKYILLLNPDTLLEEDTLNKCILFMGKEENIGGLGVKMIDGNEYDIQYDFLVDGLKIITTSNSSKLVMISERTPLFYDRNYIYLLCNKFIRKNFVYSI